MSDAIILHIACNDYRNGLPQHYADAFDFGTDAPLLCLRDGRVRYRVETSPNSNKVRYLHIGRLKVRCLGYSTWVGNWCWDAARVSIDDAARLLAYLQRSGRWTCEEGATKLFRLWHAGEPITVDDLRKMIEEYHADLETRSRKPPHVQLPGRSPEAVIPGCGGS